MLSLKPKLNVRRGSRRSNSFSGISHFGIVPRSRMSQQAVTLSPPRPMTATATSPTDPSNQKRFPFLPRFTNKESPSSRKKSKGEEQAILAK